MAHVSPRGAGLCLTVVGVLIATQDVALYLISRSPKLLQQCIQYELDWDPDLRVRLLQAAFQSTSQCLSHNNLWLLTRRTKTPAKVWHAAQSRSSCVALRARRHPRAWQVRQAVAKYDFRLYNAHGYSNRETVSVMARMGEISLLTHPSVSPLLRYKWVHMVRAVHLSELALSCVFNLVLSLLLSRVVTTSWGPALAPACRVTASSGAHCTVATPGASSDALAAQWGSGGLMAVFQVYALVVAVNVRCGGLRRHLWPVEQVGLACTCLMVWLQLSFAGLVGPVVQSWTVEESQRLCMAAMSVLLWGRVVMLSLALHGFGPLVLMISKTLRVWTSLDS